jgi:hypothetical protein
VVYSLAFLVTKMAFVQVEEVVATGGARVNSKGGGGANRTICLINMLINHLNMFVTVHSLEK